MRLTPVGVVCWSDPEVALDLASRTSLVTHADPRCVDACRVAGWAIAHLVAGAPREAVLAGIDAVAELDETRTWRARGRSLRPGDLGLDEGTRPGEDNRMGYVRYPLAAGFSALKHANAFEDRLHDVIHAGGDADTHGAIAGGILGACFGAAALPSRWVDGLADRDTCRTLAGPLAHAR